MKKGVSLMLLTMVVLVLLILVSATTISVVDTQKNIKIMEFGNEISIIQERVNLYYKKNNTYPITDDLLTVNFEVEKNIEQFENEIITEGSLNLNYLDLEKIFENDLSSYTDEYDILKYGKKANQDDIYLISTKTGKVYYKKGVYDYFTLNEELKSKIDYVENSDGMLTTSNIILKKNYEEYTNNSIITQIMIPEKYIINYCKIILEDLSEENITLLKNENGYNIYQTSDEIKSNYKILVSYKEYEDGNDIIYTNNVDNFDNVAPTIEIIGDKKYKKDSITNEEKSFYYFNCEDFESGIDIIKYEELKIVSDNQDDIDKNLEVISKYMEKNGKLLNGNIIEINPNAKYITIYARDLVGNESYLIKEIL